jgi:hypothetical protein
MNNSIVSFFLKMFVIKVKFYSSPLANLRGDLFI